METTSREAIDELHQIVGFTRGAEADEGGLAPQPDLSDDGARLDAVITTER